MPLAAVTLALAAVFGAPSATSLTLVNMAGTRLRSFPLAVKLPGGGAGLSATSEAGPLPCQVDPGDPSRLFLAVDLPAHGREVVRLAPGPAARSGLAAKWDAATGRGGISGGLVGLRIDGPEVAISTPRGSDLLDGLNFYGWLSNSDGPVPTPAIAHKRGLPYLSTRSFSSVAGRVVTSGPARAILELRKEAAGAARGMAMTERFTAFAGRPDLEYQVTIRNNRDRPVWIADCDGLIYGRWARGLAAPRRLYTSSGQNGTALGEWLSIALAGLSPDRRIWAAITGDGGGPSLGICRLAGDEANWAFTRDGFWAYAADPKGKRPIRLDPGAEVTWSFLFTTPKAGGWAAVDDVQQAFAWSRRSPVTVWLGDKPMAYGAMVALRDDFQAADRWRVEGGKLSPPVGEKGARLSVATGATEATATCALSLPLEKGTPLDLDVAAMSPGGHLIVSAQPAGGARVKLAEATRAGKVHATWPAKAGAKGWTDIELRLSLSGRSAWADLRSLSLGAAAAAPVLLTPYAGQHLPDLAVFFEWKSVPHAGHYELQFTRQADFSHAWTVRAPALDADRSVWMAPNRQELAQPTEWHWRVRAVSDDGEPGPWSAARSFTVVLPKPPRPPSRVPTSVRPLFIFHSPSDIAAAWSTIPPDLRPYCALRVEVAERGLDLKAFCRTAQEKGINVVIQCSGPGGGVYGEIYNHHYGRQSLSGIEWAFSHCPRVIGAIVVEQNFHIRSDASSAEYDWRLAQLANSTGRLLIFADGHWGGFSWLKMGCDPKLYDIFHGHPHNTVPVWKMNCGQVPLTIHGGVLGYWAAGASDHFGVEPEDWYWYEAGFKGLGQSTGVINTGNRAMMPPTFWGQMILTGLASGATCYVLEPWQALWNHDHPDQPTATWKQVVLPLVEAIARRGLVPSRETAMSAMKVAVQTRPGDLTFNLNYGAFRTLYETLYGIRQPSELIPDRSRYGFVPLLPPLAAGVKLPTGTKRVPLDRLQTAAEVHAVFDPLYPPVAKGDAFARWAGDTIVAMNNRENENVTEDFEIPVGVAGLKSLGGRLGPDSFVVGQRKGGRLWLQINGRPDRVTGLYVVADKRPELSALPAGVTAEWDAAKSRLDITVSHHTGPVDLTISG